MGDDSARAGWPTLTQASAPAAVPDAPMPHWDRYRDDGLLGEGASGRVYKAWDAKLERHVALKFLRADTAASSMRLVRESQAQARVEHEHVCKVYETGEHAGRPYIAMQFVDGPTLAAASREMSIDDKARLMIGVAEALHAAHQLGLIHRDIKPSNILVERTDRGWKPYVADFGLARELSMLQATMSGAVGTPQYMSPEQARGDNALVDRRSDVYSAGATLYALLVGRPPFEGDSAVAVMARVVGEDPAPPRKLVPALPVDLELIVLKCLEKQPQRRYQTARALADDLQRFLDGNPVTARRATILYKIGKRARKHKGLTAALAVTVAAAAALTAQQLRARYVLKERARLAEQLGRDARDLEAVLRYAYAMPLHDTRPDRARVRQRMKAIEAKAARLGEIGEGAAEYALGRGYLALHDDAAARAHLEAAWTHGQRDAPLRYALGLALGGLYRRALEEAEQLPDAELRALRRREAERLFRDPALQNLRGASDAPSESPAYVEGLIALYEGRRADALKLAAAAATESPWLYEALVLEGRVQVADGDARFDAGDQAGALAAFARAGDAYRRAREIARSDATVYEADCQRGYHEIRARAARGRVDSDVYRRALADCSLALSADPDAEPTLITQAALHASRAAHEIHQGLDPNAEIDQALERSRRARALAPQASAPLTSEAEALKLRAQYQSGSDQDPREALDQARACLQAAAAVAPDAAVYRLLGTVLGMRAEAESARGIDPSESTRQAAAALDQLLAIDPDSVMGWIHLGNVYNTQTDYERLHGREAAPSLKRAADAFARAVALAPGRVEVHDDQGQSFLEQAYYEEDHGRDPRPAYQSAAAAFQRAVEINPSLAFSYSNLGSALAGAADYEANVGIDPRPQVARALVPLSRAAELNPSDAEPPARIGIVHKIAADHLLDHDLDPSAELAAARRALESALALQATTEALCVLADTEVASARWKLRNHRGARAELTRARAAIARAHQLNPGDANTFAAEAELELQLAEAGSGEGRVAAGLAAAERALRINATHGEAAAARARLLLLRARAAIPPERRAAARAAADALAAALREHPLAAHRLDPLLSEAKKLAE
jgi:serine/threonine-protein kinase